MAKKTSNSWLSIVKKAFIRSPATNNEKKSNRRKEEEDEKKREKRKWLCRRPSSIINHVQQCDEPETKTESANTTTHVVLNPAGWDISEQRQAIAVAEDAVAAADDAVATAQAAVEIVRLGSCRPSNYYANVREQYSAIVIQAVFRGYLARRALRALKGIVKLQALVRGQNVRTQAKVALKCMQSLVRVKDRVLNQQRARLSHEGCRKSMFAETNALWESTYLQDIRCRKFMSRDIMRCTTDEWVDRPQTSEEIQELLHNKKQAALKRENALACAFSNQIWKSRRNPSAGDEKEIEARTKWLDRWMSSKQWESNNSSINRTSTDQRDCDTYKLHQWTHSSPTIRKSHHQNHKQISNSQCIVASPATPSPSKTKPILQARSASPRCLKEERWHNYSAASSPSLASTYCTTNNGISRCGIDAYSATMPNYMAATESARAKSRPQSSPRQRPSTPEKERGGSSLLAKKRLYYPTAPETETHVGINGCSSFSHNLRSPSFKIGFEKESFCSSYYTESFGGEISPCSTTDLRWLKMRN